MSEDKTCEHDYCGEYCTDRYVLHPLFDHMDRELVYLPMTIPQAGAIEYVLGLHRCKDDEPVTAIDIALAELRERL